MTRTTERFLTSQDKLKDVVERFEAAYPDGVDFTPGAQDVDFLWGKIR